MLACSALHGAHCHKMAGFKGSPKNLAFLMYAHKNKAAVSGFLAIVKMDISRSWRSIKYLDVKIWMNKDIARGQII